MTRFEKVSKYANTDIELPRPATAGSAGYDLAAAEEVVVPPLEFLTGKIQDHIFALDKNKDYYGFVDPFYLEDMADLTKELKTRPTLVSTGLKCKLDPGTYLSISARSSTPLKYWLIVANGVGRLS